MPSLQVHYAATWCLQRPETYCPIDERTRGTAAQMICFDFETVSAAHMQVDPKKGSYASRSGMPGLTVTARSVSDSALFGGHPSFAAAAGQAQPVYNLQ